MIPDPGLPLQLVHHDDVAEAIVAAVCGRGEPGVYNLAAPDRLTASDIAREMGWGSVRVPQAAVSGFAAAVERLPFTPAIAEWLTALRTPVLMDSSKAERELGIAGWHSSAETLMETVTAARERALI